MGHVICYVKTGPNRSIVKLNLFSVDRLLISILQLLIIRVRKPKFKVRGCRYATRRSRVA
jgi:hypothetical protein